MNFLDLTASNKIWLVTTSRFKIALIEEQITTYGQEKHYSYHFNLIELFSQLINFDNCYSFPFCFKTNVNVVEKFNFPPYAFNRLD